MNTPGSDQYEQLRQKLRQIITMTCREELLKVSNFSQLKIQGLLGVTIDDKDAFLVHVDSRYHVGGGLNKQPNVQLGSKMPMSPSRVVAGALALKSARCGVVGNRQLPVSTVHMVRASMNSPFGAGVGRKLGTKVMKCSRGGRSGRGGRHQPPSATISTAPDDDSSGAVVPRDGSEQGMKQEAPEELVPPVLKQEEETGNCAVKADLNENIKRQEQHPRGRPVRKCQTTATATEQQSEVELSAGEVADDRASGEHSPVKVEGKSAVMRKEKRPTAEQCDLELEADEIVDSAVGLDVNHTPVKAEEQSTEKSPVKKRGPKKLKFDIADNSEQKNDHHVPPVAKRARHQAERSPVVTRKPKLGTSRGAPPTVVKAGELTAVQSMHICCYDGCGKSFGYRSNLLQHQTACHGRAKKPRGPRGSRVKLAAVKGENVEEEDDDSETEADE